MYSIRKSAMMDYIDFQIKDLERINCLFVTTDLFYLFVRRPNHTNTCGYVMKEIYVVHFKDYIVLHYSEALL